ncbi:MAG: phage holin family protein [Polaromonas sp.]|jgi:uncharacterized membrane protein YqjE|nr:phage holin family protein [Polaromonas sp.]
MAHESGGSGPLAALRNIAATVLGTVQVRLALLANEIQTEKHHALQQLALGLALVFCLGLGVVLAVALAVILWWDSRVWLVGVFTTLFLGLAAYFYAALRRSNAQSTSPFEASLAELQEDLRQLKAAAGHEK